MAGLAYAVGVQEEGRVANLAGCIVRACDAASNAGAALFRYFVNEVAFRTAWLAFVSRWIHREDCITRGAARFAWTHLTILTAVITVEAFRERAILTQSTQS